MLNRTIAPDYQSITEIVTPEPIVYKTNEGGSIYCFHNDSLDTLRVELIFSNAGSVYDTIPGINLLCSKLLLSGTKNYTAGQIANKLATHGAFIDISPSFDYTIVTLYCLKKSFSLLIDLLREILQQQLFEKSEVHLQKQIIENQLKTQLQKSAVVASRKMREALFTESAYGRSLELSDIPSITQDGVIKYFSAQYHLGSIILTGNIDQGLINEVRDLTNNYKLNTSQHDEEPLNTSHTEKKHYSIGGTVQTSIRLAKRIPPKSHPDYFNLYISNHLLGGFFGSRLMKNLREDKGLTYGISSSLIHLQNASYQAIGCDVLAEKSDLSINEILLELKKLQKSTISSSELLLLKNQMIGALQREFSSISALSDKFKSVHFHKLNLSFYNHLLSRIETIDPEMIKNISEKYFDTESYHIITAGA